MADLPQLGRRRFLASVAGGVGGLILGGWGRIPNDFDFTKLSRAPKRSPALRSGL